MKRDPNCVFFDRRVGWCFNIGGKSFNSFTTVDLARAARQLQLSRVEQGAALYSRGELRDMGLV
jgi:hypothetical protein